MPKGRKPTPPMLKALRGNPGKRPITAGQPNNITPLGDARPPEWFDDVAREQWYRLLPELRRLGVFASTDYNCLAVYCVAISDYARYNEILNGLDDHTQESENGRDFPHPLFGMKNTAARLALAYAGELGLTPASRCRVHTSTTLNAKDDLDRLLDSRPE